MAKIGIFDSGYGGLTILRSIRQLMPQYDYIYLGDNARAPYGPRSFETVYHYTRQAVEALFRQDCQLVILACNTASAKALRTIQQNDLTRPEYAGRRVLGVIRPTVEVIGELSKSKHVGLLATVGTVKSNSYALEIEKLHPDISLTSLACPMWVPLVEYGEYNTEGAEYFVKKRITQLLNADPQIDTVILGCTHYPILLPVIEKYTKGMTLVTQGKYVAIKLRDYLMRHPDIEQVCSKNGQCRFLTTESTEVFSQAASVFLDESIGEAEKISIE